MSSGTAARVELIEKMDCLQNRLLGCVKMKITYQLTGLNILEYVI